MQLGMLAGFGGRDISFHTLTPGILVTGSDTYDKTFLRDRGLGITRNIVKEVDHEQENFSAEQHQTTPHSRIPCQNENQGRQSSYQQKARKRPPETCRLRYRSIPGHHPACRTPLLPAMRALSLPKSCLLRKPWEYKNVYHKGKRIRGQGLTIIHTPNGRLENRLGISVHGIRKAVVRNRIKRIIREFYRLNRNFIEPGSDIVFAIREPFNPDSPEEVSQFVHKIMAPSIKNS